MAAERDEKDEKLLAEGTAFITGQLLAAADQWDLHVGGRDTLTEEQKRNLITIDANAIRTKALRNDPYLRELEKERDEILAGILLDISQTVGPGKSASGATFYLSVDTVKPIPSMVVGALMRKGFDVWLGHDDPEKPGYIPLQVYWS
jgi:hypothetical protein